MDDVRTSVLEPGDGPVPPELLAAAADAIAHGDRYALAGLALPAGALPGACWTRTAGGVTYRGAHLSPQAATDPAAVADWARSFWSDRDRSLPPAGPVHRWVRSVRSGTARWVWGPGELWDGPSLRCGTDVTVDQVVELLGRWRAGAAVEPPTLFDTGTGTVLVDGDDACWSLTGTGDRPAPVDGPSPAVAGLAASITADLGGSDWAVAPTGPATWECRLQLPGWTVLVDLRVHQRSAVVGRRVQLPAGVPPQRFVLPTGWTAESCAGDTVAAVHTSGLRAVLRPDRHRRADA